MCERKYKNLLVNKSFSKRIINFLNTTIHVNVLRVPIIKRWITMFLGFPIQSDEYYYQYYWVKKKRELFPILPSTSPSLYLFHWQWANRKFLSLYSFFNTYWQTIMTRSGEWYKHGIIIDYKHLGIINVKKKINRIREEVAYA